MRTKVGAELTFIHVAKLVPKRCLVPLSATRFRGVHDRRILQDSNSADSDETGKSRLGRSAKVTGFTIRRDPCLRDATIGDDRQISHFRQRPMRFQRLRESAVIPEIILPCPFRPACGRWSASLQGFHARQSCHPYRRRPRTTSISSILRTRAFSGQMDPRIGRWSVRRRLKPPTGPRPKKNPG